jgi:hypothetical protein
MANNNSNPNNTAFSGFPGGHDSGTGFGYLSAIFEIKKYLFLFSSWRWECYISNYWFCEYWY